MVVDFVKNKNQIILRKPSKTIEYQWIGTVNWGDVHQKKITATMLSSNYDTIVACKLIEKVKTYGIHTNSLRIIYLECHQTESEKCQSQKKAANNNSDDRCIREIVWVLFERPKIAQCITTTHIFHKS